MKSINELNSKLLQTFVRLTNDDDKLKVFVKQNNFAAGHIILSERTFHNVQRTAKNLFLLFGSPGLGINSEILNIILPAFSIDTIKIIYEGDELITTVSKWKRLGIISPFGNQSRIDKQVILDLNEINLDNSNKYFDEVIKQNQLSLFSEPSYV